MQSGDRLSPEKLAQEAVNFSGQAKTILIDAEFMADGYPVKDGFIFVNNPGLSIMLGQNIIAIIAHQFNPQDNGATRYLPELSHVLQISLSTQALKRHPLLQALHTVPEGEDRGNIHISFSYQMGEAVAVARYELDQELTLNNGDIILASRSYCFNGNGLFKKSVELEGLGDFMDPLLLRRNKGKKHATFHAEDLPIRVGEVELIGVGIGVIRERLTDFRNLQN